MEMLCRVPVLRGIAAADVTASEAQTQMDPAVTHFDAIFTDVFCGLKIPGFFDVFAVLHSC